MFTRSVYKSVEFWKELCEILVQKHIQDYQEKNANKLCKDIVLGDVMNNIPHVLTHVNIIKYIQIKIGMIWQCLMGAAHGIQNLGCGHHSSLDLLVHKSNKKYIIELKNSYNTDNSSSRKHNFEKLHSFISSNKGYIGIYAIINCKTKTGIDKIIKYKGYNIRLLSGMKLLKFIFGNESEIVLTQYKNAIKNILQNISKN